MNKFDILFHSRKFWAGIIGLLLVVLRHFSPSFPLSDDELAKMVYLLIAYIIGSGLQDAGTITTIGPSG